GRRPPARGTCPGPRCRGSGASQRRPWRGLRTRPGQRWPRKRRWPLRVLTSADRDRRTRWPRRRRSRTPADSDAIPLWRTGRPRPCRRALEIAIEGAAAAKRDRQAWAMHMFDLWRGRELQQLGRLEDGAALLNAHFTPGELLPAVGDAAALVALGRIGLHTADRRLIRETGDLAKVMLEESSPGVRRH